MDGLDAYRHNAIETRTPGQLIVLLYDGAIKFLRKAVEELEARRYVEKGKCINRAVDIIRELNVCLDMDAGGEVAQNLAGLYNFIVRHLGQANVKRDPEMVREVIKLLEELNEGWKAIAT